MNEYLILSFRIISIMILFLIGTLLTGRRHIGELPVFDFLVIMTLGSVVGADIAEPNIPHLPVAFAVVLILLLQFIHSVVVIKNRKIGKILTFEPVVIIQNGEFVKSNLKKIRYSIDIVLTLLREKGIFYLEEVDFAIIESTGNLSVLKKSQYDSITKNDMNIAGIEKGLPLSVIIEGKVYENVLNTLNLDMNWLTNELKIQGITNINDVFFACVDSSKKLYASKGIEYVDKINDIKH